MLMYGTILKSRGLTNFILLSNTISFLISIPLMLFMVIQYGILGAVITMVCAHAINTIIQLYLSKRELNISWTNFLPFNKFLPFILLGSFTYILVLFFQKNIFTVYFVQDILFLNKFLNIILSSSIFCIIYTILSKLSGTFDILNEPWLIQFMKKIGIYRAVIGYINNE